MDFSLLHSGFLLGLHFYPEDGGDVSPKLRLTGIYVVIHVFQKMELFRNGLVRFVAVRAMPMKPGCASV
jgi:hypothetical protein